MTKIKCALLGSTGVVGQAFVSLLAHHPYFQLSLLAASAKNQGQTWGSRVNWHLPLPFPTSQAGQLIEPPDIKTMKARGITIVFSALPAKIAGQLEPRLREEGFFVFSNAGALRRDPGVPILIPEINGPGLASIETQGYPQKGFVVTNANCSTTGLALALAPLKKFGLQEVTVSTYQSLSGAGYPGVSALDITANALPHIPGEEEKIVYETQKILESQIQIYPSCTRIPTLWGHLENVWITCKEQIDTTLVLEAWAAFAHHNIAGPTTPSIPIIYKPDRQWPQPGHSFWGDPPGMSVSIGQLKEKENRIGFTLLVNNIIRGAAGGSIQNAEYFIQQYGGEK